MTVLETVWKISVASPVVWRMTRMVSSAYDAAARQGSGGASGLARLRPEEVLGSRVMDFLYWIGLWMSAQTALWVVCGFAGVLLNWFAISGIARLASRTKLVPLTARRSFSPVVASSLDIARETEQHAGAAQLCQ